MFIYDRPIQKIEEDLLDRSDFSEQLSKAIQNWQEEESLVISLDGEWGVGKSSVINLVKSYIEASDGEKPMIFEYNPWAYSEVGNLTASFFNELAKELKLKDKAKSDKKLAEKLKAYSQLLGGVPEKSVMKSLYEKLGIAAGLVGLGGISVSAAFERLGVGPKWVKLILFSIGSLLIIAQLFKDQLLKISTYYETRSKANEKTLNELKKEIKNDLSKRNKKLLLIIDDIDRLSQNEIKHILKLIRVNADFPNTVFLLAFDREVVEANLKDQLGVSGKNYLDKIIQVSFHIPEIRVEKIHQYLFKELDRILNTIPNIEKFIGEDSIHWVNLYHSGFKGFFTNLRDVKRYISSLEFNLSMLLRNGIVEVNPIDFLGIEAIRVFVPTFYDFIKINNELFTSTDRTYSGEDDDRRKVKITDALSKVPDHYRSFLEELIERLFPQVEGVLRYGYSSYGDDWQKSWSKELKICSSRYFEAYFSLIPGGDVSELTQYELEQILSSMTTLDGFEIILNNNIENGKILKVLSRLQDYTDDDVRIPIDYFENVITALFNISDSLPEKRQGMFEVGADIQVVRIVYQLLKRQSDRKSDNFFLLDRAIRASKSLYAAIQRVSFESKREYSQRTGSEVLNDEDVVKLQQLCVERIIDYEQRGDLINQRKLLYILFRWKEWDETEGWKHFVNNVVNSDYESLLKFLNFFISFSFVQSAGDYASRTESTFNKESLSHFIEDIGSIESKLLEIKNENGDMYRKYQLCIDSFLSGDQDDVD